MRARDFLNESNIKAYHGNQGGINTEELVTPMWFTENFADAKSYAGEDGFVVTANLKILNPYIIKPKDNPNTIIQNWQSLEHDGYDGIYDPTNKDWIPFRAEQIQVTSKKRILDELYAKESTAKGSEHTAWGSNLSEAVLDANSLVDVYIRGTHQGTPITKLVARDFPNQQIPALIQRLVDKYNINPNSVVYGPGRTMNENFADGRKPGRKGLSRRVGIPKKPTLAQLEKIAQSSTGERRRMAQWQLNMRRGKQKKNK